MTTWLDVARMPADLATAFLPNGDRGPKVRIQLLVDKVDAGARTIVGGLLGDEELQADGARRRAAADERVEALRLRDVAEEKKANAELRVEKAREQAKEHAGQAQREAKQAIDKVAQQAEQLEERVEQQADEAERKVEEARREELERTDKATKRARLEAVEEKAEALDAEAAALTAADEAERLADAAASAKAERKQTG
ncbi:MAG TPA: hypothetical protein VJ804_14015 [Acidimicrobiales bacterium]|nr:hypothetical protein [Acidimicrobiales bacterium]